MKKLFALLSFVLLMNVAVFGQTFIVNGQKITLANTNQLEIQFSNTRSVTTTAYVQIVTSSAGVKVGTETLTAAHHDWPAGSKIPITFTNGILNVRLKGNSGDVIVITY
jgi:hypothetical protein